MNKLLSLFGLAIAAAALTGCELYFGEDNNDNWSYCGADGYYVCQGDACEWAGAECPGGGGGGFSCESDADCAAGCYCQNGVCEEGGFCSADTDCPDGFHCDESRSSCVPNGCATDADCLAGQTCQDNNCVTTCVCENDQQAKDAGFGYCDETRSTCMPGEDPAGSCVGQVTCNLKAPTCAAGEVPLIKDGCYTGACRAIAQCDAAPTCAALTHEPDCLARTADCRAVYTGINCTKPDGTQCNAGDTNCTCESFKFNSCESRSARLSGESQLYFDSAGNPLTVQSLFH
ncbi:MAG TPA: hypothetical protein VFQ53_00325 [Kofleriaceae bacterium]|nr:hypothetical protein [Kofleriaceae bacterium]